jgi:hypothetical protein
MCDNEINMGEEEILELENRVRKTNNFNPLDYCPSCGSRGRVVFHGGDVEEILCRNKKCYSFWLRLRRLE